LVQILATPTVPISQKRIIDAELIIRRTAKRNTHKS